LPPNKAKRLEGICGGVFVLASGSEVLSSLINMPYGLGIEVGPFCLGSSRVDLLPAKGQKKMHKWEGREE